MSLPLGNGPRSLGIFYNLGGTTQELLPHVSSCMWLVSRLLDSKGIAVVPKVTEPENFVSGPQASLLCVLKASWNFPGGLLVKNRPRVRYLGQTMQGTRVQSLVLEDPICHGQLSLDTTTTEPGPCTENLCSATRGAPAMSSPTTTMRESWEKKQKENKISWREN